MSTDFTKLWLGEEYMVEKILLWWKDKNPYIQYTLENILQVWLGPWH